MSDYLTDIEARIEQTTDGPWRVGVRNSGGAVIVPAEGHHPFLRDAGRVGIAIANTPDAEFIAYARTDLPRLLAAIRAVDEAISGIELDVRFRSDWEDGRVALAQEIRVALTAALGLTVDGGEES